MKRLIPAGLSVVVAVLLVLPLSATAAAAQQDRHSLSGDRVAVYNLAGEVTIQRGSGSAVLVDVRVGGADASELTFATGQVCGANALRIIYPDDDVVYSEYRGNSRVRVRDDGTFYGSSNWHRDYSWGCSSRRSRDDYEVEIDNRGRGLEAWADLIVSVPAGQEVEIYLAVGRVTARNVAGTLMLDLGAVTVDASDIAGELLVDTGSGSVTANGVTGNVIIDTGSGRVEVDDVEGDILIADTGSGGVEGRSISVNDLTVDTGSGSVDLQRVSSPNVLVDTGSGSVTLDLTTAVDRLTVDTGSGSVDVTLPGTLDARIEIDTGSGGIDVDFPISVSRWQRDHVEGIIGEGTGRILIDTGSGGVRLRQRM